MNKKIVKYTLIIFGTLFLGGISLLIHLFIQGKFGVYVHPRASPPPVFFHSKGIDIEHPSLLYPADPTNDQVLLGASHNVFTGKVLAQAGNKETEIGPRTQYHVQVIDNIKGELKGAVTMDMLGGYDKGGKLILVEDESLSSGNSLLQPGSSYLFATRFNAQESWHTVIAHPNARKVLSKDESMNEGQLRALAASDERVRKFEAAYISEILDAADIAHGNTRNSFQSLPPEAKAAAQSRADAARASLDAMQLASPAVQ